MIRFLRGYLPFILILFSVTSITAQRELVDRIVAIVGDEVILASEVASQIQLAAFQGGRNPENEEELKEMTDEILEQMVSEKLFLIAARKDTAISVRPDEVDQALDNRIGEIAKNFSSHDDFLEAIAAEGLTLRGLRKRFRGDVENQILKQRFIQKKLNEVSISRHEVEGFYIKFRDSIPSQPEAARLAHVLLVIEPSREVEDSIRALAGMLRQKIMDGADFATVSMQYSSLGAGANGGDLGYVSRSDVVEKFARAAFRLRIGDISGVVRTKFGYHVIKCEGRRDDRLKLRHLLLAVQPSADDTMRVVALADSLLKAVRDGASFEETAKIFSADNETRAEGGILGWFAIEQLPPEFSPVVTGWKTVGEYRGPVFARQGIHLLKLLDYQPEKEYTLDEDYDDIKELARQDKTGRLVDDWIEEFKAETFIEYRLDDINAYR
ncbi:MAG: peptidylprolyl isomerase [candidate division Zixibacteria bacterium]|nr:peptidylprolyl isomerase [candidate division Zixibacteria bacterium]